MPEFPEFDEVHVISDLHMGGSSGFQVFDLGHELARVIDRLAARKTENGKLALVINGDMVDFLAEQNATAFDPDGAAEKLERIAGDDAFKPVFEALQRFTEKPGRTLAITLGNHDLELALPWVKKKLVELLVKESSRESARHSVRLAFDGRGFRCEVGGRSVLAIHGNDVDLWNLTDYERLRRIARDVTFGLVPEKWTPNAGSRLVVEVMNEIKQKFPFIDLLKPEFEAAVPILVTLRPTVAAKIKEVAALIGRRIIDGGKRSFDLLGAEKEGYAEAQLGRILSQQGINLDELSREDLLASTETRLRQPIEPASLADLETGNDLLGWKDLPKEVVSFVRNKLSQRATRFFFDRYSGAPMFDLDHADGSFEELDLQVGGEIDYLLAGHTHLARHLQRPSGGYYLNSGTWIPLILPNRSTYPLDQHGKGFEKLWKALQQNRSKLMSDQDLVQRQPRIAQVLRRESGAVGRLVDLSAKPLLESSDADLDGWLWDSAGEEKS